LLFFSFCCGILRHGLAQAGLELLILLPHPNARITGTGVHHHASQAAIYFNK
jgi:hypothetical protein